MLALNWPSLTTTVTTVLPVWPDAGVTDTVRLEPLPPKTKLLAGTSVGFAAKPLTDKFPAGVFASPTVNAFAAVGVASDVLWLARVEIVGAVLVPVTVSTKVSVTSFGPSFTVTVMMLVPFRLGAGVTVTVRFAPKPPNTMLFTGTSAGFDEPALNCKFAAATCASPMVNGIAAVATPSVVVRFVMSEIVGGVSVVPQLGKIRASRVVASPVGSVTVRMTR